MDRRTVLERIKLLRQEIAYHRNQYHTYDIESISPEVLDSLKHELAELESQYPEYITPDSPTQRIGGVALESFEKHTHQYPMTSLSDVFSFEELSGWDERNRKLISAGGEWVYCAELKLDGLAISLVYRNSTLQVAATRGNGLVGEDVTHNVATIHDVPLQIQGISSQQIEGLNRIRAGWGDYLADTWDGTIEVRGEVYIRYSDFERMNARLQDEGNSPFANTRNMAAGSLRQLDSSVAASRNLRFFAWQFMSDLGQQTQYEEWLLLQALGFPVVQEMRCANSLSDIQKFHTEMYSLRSKIDFAYDGIVVKVNSKNLQQQLGYLGKGPRFMVAYKFEAEEATTIVRDIKLQVGRTGKVTPVAVMDPVHVYGVTVSHATLHNQEEIQRLGLMIGDTVVIQRAGDVIPEITKVLEGLRSGEEYPFSFPHQCPVCQTELVQKEGQVNRMCPNQHCPARTLRHLTHFVSDQAFNIRGLSKQVLAKLEEAGLVQDESDILCLSYDEVRLVPGLGDISAQKIVQAVKDAKHIMFSRFIQALGIPHIGEQTAKLLAHHFSSLSTLMEAPQSELEALPDIGSIVATSIVTFFQDTKNQEKISKLLKHGVIIQYPSLQNATGRFDGKQIVITGSIDTLSRKESIAFIESEGGIVRASVSNNTDIVIVGRDPGSKYQKAIELNIVCMDAEEFIALYHQKH